MTQPLYGYINQPKYLWLRHLKQKFYTRCLTMKSRIMINTNTTCLTMPSQTMNDQHTFNTKILNKKLFWFDLTLIWKISYFLKWVLMNHPNIVALLWKKRTEWFNKQHWPSNAHIFQYLNCTDYQCIGKW